MEKLENSPFCPEIDRIKSSISNGDIWVLLAAMTGLIVLIHSMCITIGI